MKFILHFVFGRSIADKAHAMLGLGLQAAHLFYYYYFIFILQNLPLPGFMLTIAEKY